MAYNTPHTASTGLTITSSGHNTSIRDNIEYLKGRAGTIAFEAGATFNGGVQVLTGGIQAVGSGGIFTNGGDVGVNTAVNGDVRRFRIDAVAGDLSVLALELMGQSSNSGFSFQLTATTRHLEIFDIVAGSGQLVARLGHNAATQWRRQFMIERDGVAATTVTNYAIQPLLLQSLSDSSKPVGIGFHRPGVSAISLMHQGGGADYLYIDTGAGTGAASKFTLWSKAHQGTGTGMDSDSLRGLIPSNGSGQLPISNGTLNTNLNAQFLSGLALGHGTNQIPYNDANVNTNLRADMADRLLAPGAGHVVAGNASANIPFSNAVRCVNLNADFLDGLDSTQFAQLTGAAFSGNISTSGTVSATGNIAGSTFQPSSNVGLDFGGGYFIQTTAGPGIGFGAGGSLKFEQRSGTAIFSTPGTYVTSWTAVSDRRLKAEIQDIGSALELVRKLRPVTYVASEDGIREGMVENVRRAGLIAQELADVFPDLVGSRPAAADPLADAYLTADYSTLSVYLAAAISELSAEVDTIKARLAG